MSTMQVALFGSLFASILVQFCLAAGFVYRLRSWKRPLLGDASCPPVAVVLCLRGGDPFLSRCIGGLLAQNYPNYEVCFMVDNSDDPAMPILEKAIAENSFARFRIEVLASPLSTCSLKCSSLVQAVEGLPDSIEVVALLDADTIPHSTWLRELATALEPMHVGAATGNRWYMPSQCSQGSLVRYVWNAAAIVQMYWYSIAWGGTLAIKMDSIRRAGILDRWRLAYSDDTLIRSQLSSIGQKVVFVPSLMMINREDCSMSSFQGWVKRQLLAARLYHPFWLFVVVHGFSSVILVIWGLLTCVVLLAQGDMIGAIFVFLALLFVHVCLTSMLPWIERSVCMIAKARGEDVSWPRKPSWLTNLWIAWLTQWTYTWALFRCLFLKRFNWRGIDYEVAGPWSIKMLGYRPYRKERTGDEQVPQSI